MRNPILAGFAVFLLLGLLLGAVSPDHHERLHPEASSPEHSCAVTTLADGQVLAAQPEGLVQSPDVGSGALAPVTVSSQTSSHLKLLPPERAPPAPVA